MNTTEEKKSKTLNITLWISQFILASLFLMAGFMKTTMPIDRLSATLPWTKDVPIFLVRFIGICELSAVIGLLLPSLLRIKPILTPIAASGLILIMIPTIIFHISRGEPQVIGMHIVFILLSSFIIWGRTRKEPIRVKP
jgi:putative oxidoreductase